MLNTILAILVTIALFLAPIGCFWLQKKLAKGEDDRIKTGWEMILAPIFCIVALVVYLVLLFFWEQFGWDPDKRKELVLCYPGGIYMLYLLLAWLMNKLSGRLFKDEDWQPTFSMKIYRKRRMDNGTYRWVIPRHFSSWRVIIRRIMMVLFLFMLFLLVAFMFGKEEISYWYMVPVCGVIFLRTFSLFLGGPLEAGGMSGVKGDGLQSSENSNYALAADHLERSFKNALLYRSPVEAPGILPSTERTLRGLEQSENLSDRLVCAYFRSEYRHEPLEPDYVYAAARMLDRQHVLFFNPFYEDLGLYLAMPLNDSLMAHKKVLILCEGNSSMDHVRKWMKQALDHQARFAEKWKVRILEDLVSDCDVGILSYSRLYEPDVLYKNRDFFKNVRNVILLEPSASLSSIQTGLNVLADLLREKTDPVYCILDRELNGLKDTLSHVLKVRFENECVITSQAIASTVMMWDADADFQPIERFQRETAYLGGGIELGAEAISMQIPNSRWIAQSGIPLYDIQDNAARSYQAICRLMQIDAGQTVLRQHLTVSPAYWQQKAQERAFLIVEDEFHNPFAIAESYRSRARKDIFLNILSEDYLLRDYFTSNADVFRTNPNSVPCLVPAYAKTSRNLLIRLLLRMRISPMKEEKLAEELLLASIETDDPITTLRQMIAHYTTADEDLLQITIRKYPQSSGKPRIETWIGIRPEDFDETFARSLKTVSYVLEDEQLSRHYLKSNVYSLITQNLLPNQHLTFEGRNYYVRQISSANGVILRRASDLVAGRRQYRQCRTYSFTQKKADRYVFSEEINGFLFDRYDTTVTVDTPAYIETISRDGIIQTKKHVFSHPETQDELRREYRNKTILRIGVPDLDQPELAALAFLMQELLPSVLPEGAPYLAILAKLPENAPDSLKNLLYQSEHVEDHELVIVEDSDMDLGLLDVFEKNFFRFLEIVQDYLRFRRDQLRAAQNKKDADHPDQTTFQPEVSIAPGQSDSPRSDKSAGSERNQMENKSEDEPSSSDLAKGKEKGKEKANGKDQAKTTNPDSSNQNSGSIPEVFIAGVELEQLVSAIDRLYTDENTLTRARTKPIFEDQDIHVPKMSCALCGMPILGTSYMTLEDGRICCRRCVNECVGSRHEVEEIYHMCLKRFRQDFGVDVADRMNIVFGSAKERPEEKGHAIMIRTNPEGLPVGMVMQEGDSILLWIENGISRLVMIYIIMQALCYTWQQTYWDMVRLYKLCEEADDKRDGNLFDAIVKGMMTWTAVQSLYMSNETQFATEMDAIIRPGYQPESIGYRLYKQTYPFQPDPHRLRRSPFVTQIPVDLDELKNQLRQYRR